MSPLGKQQSVTCPFWLCVSRPGRGVLRLLVHDDLPPVLLVRQLDLVAELALELLHPRAHPPELVLEPEDMRDAGEVQAQLGGQTLHQAQPLDVELGVEPRAAGRARGPDEAACLVHPERLRVEARELGGDGDHVAAALGHQDTPPPSRSRGCSRSTSPYASSASFSAFVSFFGTVTRRRASRSPLPPPFSFGAPRPFTRRSFPFSEPAGTFRATGPCGVGIWTLAPSAASGYVTGTSSRRSAPRRS